MMDFFTNPKAKRALHRNDLVMQDIALNFTTQRPQSATVLDGIKEMTPSKTVRPVRPLGVMGSMHARGFSAAARDDEREQAIIDAQMEAASTSEKKGKFMSFLSAAEEIDEKVSKDASFAKQVEGQEAETLDFNSDEIDIEFNFEKEIKDSEKMRFDMHD